MTKVSHIPFISKGLYNTRLFSKVRSTNGHLSIAPKIVGEGSIV